MNGRRERSANGEKGQNPSQLLSASPAMASIKTKLYENMWGTEKWSKK
jgi:hypothetical protein